MTSDDQQPAETDANEDHYKYWMGQVPPWVPEQHREVVAAAVTRLVEQMLQNPSDFSEVKLPH